MKWFKKNKISIIIILILLLFFIIPLYKVWDFQYLYTSDPWHHMYFTKYVESNSFYGKELLLSDGNFSSHYPTLMRSYLYEFHLLTNIDYLIIFKYFGFIIRLLTILFFIILLKIFTKNKKYIFIGVLLLLSGFYFWYRSYITFTENFVIFFHLIILFYSLLFLKNHKVKYLILSTFFVSISLYYHYPSAIIPFFIYFSTLFIYLFRNFNKKSIYLIFLNLLLFILLSFNSLIGVLNEYIGQIKNNVGETGGYGDLNRFIPPNLDTYQNYQSEIIILFSFIGVLILLKNIRIYIYIYFPFIILLLLTFILSNGTRFYLNLPTDRMQSFLMIPIGILSFLGFIYIIKRFSYIYKFILIFLLIILSTNNVVKSKGWFKVWRGEIPTGEYLIDNYSNERKYYFEDNVSFQELQFPFFNNIIINKDNIKDGDWIISREKSNIFNLIYNKEEIFIYEK